jgi:hypothetical protein
MASETPAAATNSKGAESYFYPNDHHREKLKQYESSCHCGTIQFKFLLPPLETISVYQCNCSICDINGYLNVYPFHEDIEWITSKEVLEKSLGTYRWNSKLRKHHFCKECGTSMCIDFQDVGNTPIAAHWAVNARTIKGVDWRTLTLQDFDGKQWPLVDAK